MYKEYYKLKRRLSTKKWRENNPEKVKEYSKVYEQRDKTKQYRKQYSKTKGAINAKNWRIRNPIKSRDSALKYSYGITSTDYNKLFVEQNGVCAICKEKQEDSKSLCVDHDHTTGKIRGLLCRACNSGLGHLKESVSILISSIEYLRNSNK